jgi:Methylase involved in ubiquinone/menaquinone biosynthesis
MSFYGERVLPHLVHMSMRQTTFDPYRRRVVSAATGRVLEIGVGSGLNLPLYEAPTHVIGLEPSANLLAMARTVRTIGPSIELLEGVAEAIPLARSLGRHRGLHLDTLLDPDVTRALTEIRRVLVPRGCLLFAEHGRSPEPRVVAWQNRLTPLWKRIGGGCHLNRPIDELIRAAGFHVEQLQTGYMKGPKPMTFMYEGVARS